MEERVVLLGLASQNLLPVTQVFETLILQRQAFVNRLVNWPQIGISSHSGWQRDVHSDIAGACRQELYFS